MKIWIMLAQKSIRSFIRWRKERKQNKNFSFLVEQSPVKQSAFLQNNVEKRLSHGLGIPLFLSKRMDLIY